MFGGLVSSSSWRIWPLSPLGIGGTITGVLHPFAEACSLVEIGRSTA